MDIAEVAKKYGALGIVCVWLAITNLRVATLENKLDDCYGERINEMRHSTKKAPHIPEKIYAILPEPIKIKKS